MDVIITKPTISPMVVAEFQALRFPPHCTASSSITTPGTKSARPGRSRCFIFWARGSLVNFPSLGRKKIVSVMAVTAPRGRLM